MPESTLHDSMTECELTTKLFEELNRLEVRYCHWKSNNLLKEALCGLGDLDLLVASESAAAFDAVLAQLGFRPVATPSWNTHAGICHYYGLDEPSGRIFHLHVYYRLATGGTLLKRYRLPLEEMMFANLRYVSNVAIPGAAAELVLLVLRKTLEFGEPTEYPFLWRQLRSIRAEIDWLDRDGVADEAAALWQKWLPSVEVGIFSASLSALRGPGLPFLLVLLGRRLRAALRSLSFGPGPRSGLLATYRFGRYVARRLLGPRRSASPVNGGAVIAFVGPDASGKSTLAADTRRWLGGFLAVDGVHAGKPPASWLTAAPNSLLPVLRWALPKRRTSAVEFEAAESDDRSAVTKTRSLLYVVRCVTLAYDRWRLLTTCQRTASRGTIVICDRYPSSKLGGTDCPRLDPAWFENPVSLSHLLAKVEQAFYARMPRPDLVLLLVVPVETVVERNVTRDKEGATKDPRYVRFRHPMTEGWFIPGVTVVEIDAGGSLDETILTIRREVWRVV